MLHRPLLGAALAVAVLLPAASPAVAAPVTVNLRVEGPTKTIFEGPVTTDARTFHFTNDSTEHECAGTAATGGSSPTPVPVRNAALLTAAEQAGLALTGTWFSFGPSFDRVGDESVAFDAATNRFLVEYKNGQEAAVGGCSDPIAAGDDVLYAYAASGDPLLSLTVPATAAPGQGVTARVTAGGQPVAGATVGGATTGTDGSAVVGPFADRGPHDLKASKAGAVRSARASVCVTDGQDGFCQSATPAPGAGAPCVTLGNDGLCGTADRRAPLGRILSVKEGRRFAKGHGPRSLAGRVDPDPSGLRDVRLRLTRNDGNRCSTYDGRAERLTPIKRCGAVRGRWFSVGDRADWSYLLPARLGRGRYVLDVRAYDKAGNADTTLQRTRNRVVFVVR